MLRYKKVYIEVTNIIKRNICWSLILNIKKLCLHHELEEIPKNKTKNKSIKKSK